MDRQRTFFLTALLAALLCTPQLANAQPVATTNSAAEPAAQESAQIDVAFSRHYWRNDGARILGLLESAPITIEGRLAQYFEKARLEDHQGAVANPAWRVMYGRVVAELISTAPATQINGTDRTYGDLAALNLPQSPPDGFKGGTQPVAGGVFVPLSSDLSPAPGFMVADVFWGYLVRPANLPGGWLHDLGLPLTGSVEVLAAKAEGQRTVLLQAFERGILTYDPANPAEWQVERANVGTDALLAQGLAPLHAQPAPRRGIHSIEIDLSEQWLYAYDGDIRAFDAPVSTGKDGFNTPTGSFAIYKKYRLRTMRGSAGGETWVVPDVPHAMFFTGDVALHGAYWHNRFGTGARLSHGCVNLPLDAAAWIYEWAPVGTPVIVVR
jgi:L,D-transpeptidase catalytic domain